MNAATAKIIGLLICISATTASAEAPLPKCVLYSFGHCSGSFKYSNGDIYIGEFNYGKPDGNGKITYANGDIYIGFFLDGQKHGFGDYTWADGNKYIGIFFQGALDGRGVYYFYANNKVNPDKYVGEFRNNSFNGEGIYTFSNGKEVSGRFKGGKKIDDSVTNAIIEVKEKKLEVAPVSAPGQAANRITGDSSVTQDKNQTSISRDQVALAEIQRLELENIKLKAQLQLQLNPAQNNRITAGKEKADIVESHATAEIKTIENQKSASSSEMLSKVSAEAKPNSDSPVPAEAKNGLLANFGIDLDRYQVQSKLFISASMNSVGISVANVQLANGSVDNEKINATPKNVPFSVGLGYNLGGNYGLELGLKYHGEQKPLGNISDDNIYKSSTLLLGAFFDYPIYSGIGLSVKGGIQNTDTVIKITALKYLGNGQYDNLPTIYSSSSNVSNGYYGLGINYAVNKDNKIFIDWTRVRSSIWNYANPSALQDVNTDVAEFGFKHTF